MPYLCQMVAQVEILIAFMYFAWAELATAQTEVCSALRLSLGVLGKVSASIANGNTKQKENDIE